MTEQQIKVNFFENGLCFLCHMARGQLYDFTQFHTETEASWKKKDDALQGNLDKELQLHHEFQHHDIIDNYAWDLHQNQYQFPNMHRESLVITIYNFLEAKLNDLCNIIASSIDSKIKLKDLKGHGVTRAFIYLTKVANIDFSAMNQEQSYIRNINLLRNQIVHNGGYLPDASEKQLNSFVFKNSNLSGAPNNSVTLSQDFILEFINTLIKFFDKLDIEIQDFIRRENA